METIRFADRILRYIKQRGYEPQKLEELARSMKIAEAETGDFHAACKALMKTGRVVLGSRSGLTLPEPAGKIMGVFRANPRGFGFVIPDTPNAHGDLFVPPGKTAGALTGDTVSARVHHRRRGRDQMVEGEIVAILQRGQSQCVGQLRHELARWFVIPDGTTLHAPIMVADVGAKGAKAGDQVVLEIIQYPTPEEEGRGVIVRVLGKPGEPEVDTQSIIAQYDIPAAFPEAVVEEARRATAGFKPPAARTTTRAPRRGRAGRGVADGESGGVDWAKREFLDHLTIVTIDPVDARDFDDAISLTPAADEFGEGAVELGVHIADVSTFVRGGGALDAEAGKRANSVYFPRTVIPMLPELLSNGVCSLQEKEWRLTKSAFITYDADGVVKKTRFGNTVIKSAKRLTYEQAGRILDGKAGRTGPKIVELLTRMDRLARAIRARRIREGMLVLNLPDVELVHDEEGRVIDVAPEDAHFSHTIIEMFMVEANEAVCRLLAGHGVPHLRRVHDEPSFAAQQALRRFLRALGRTLPRDADRFTVQRLLDAAKDDPASFPINLAVLRSMQKAEYSPQLVGHYALASTHYCHFTSPIRRYADLTIHRLLDRYFAGGLKGRGSDGVPSYEDLTELGQHCSTNERRAEAAERELKLVKILRLLQTHIGDIYQGTVTGVSNFGVYVQLDKYLIDGVLRFNDMADDWWEADTERGEVVGARSGRRIKIGDRIEVVSARIDVARRELDLALAAAAAQPGCDRKGVLPEPPRDRKGVPLPSRDRKGVLLPSRDRKGVLLPSRDRQGATPGQAARSKRPRGGRPEPERTAKPDGGRGGPKRPAPLHRGTRSKGRRRSRRR